MILPLDSSPVATFLVGLAERRASGTVTLVSRTIHLVTGEIGEVSPAPGDPSFGEFLVQSERLSAAALSDVRSHAAKADIGFEAALVTNRRMSKPELKALLRASRLDRFVRELRQLSGHSKLLPTLDATQRVTAFGAYSAPLLPFVLDAWTRLAADADAAAVGMRIDYRLVWVECALLGEAQRWASLPDVQDRPVVSTVLGRVPAAAAEIAALVRTGFVRLVAPGAAPTKQRSRKDTLPPPPPRLVTLADVGHIPSPSEAPSPVVLALSSAPPPPRAATPLPAAASLSANLRAIDSVLPSSIPSPAPAALPTPAPGSGLSPVASLRPSAPRTPLPDGTRTRAPRLLLQPGAAGDEIAAIPEVKLKVWPEVKGALHDPLRELELQVGRLEEQNASGRERARAFIQLAALWQTRIGSLEQSTRALREAAAADPDDTLVLLQTARQCGALGQLSLALAYARAVAFTAASAAERAAGHRALADLHAAQGDADRALEALSEAAAEDPENPEPHELLAQLHSERGNVQLAVAHAQRAALGYAGRAPKRSLGWNALAYAWDPSDPIVCESYRNALHATGHIEAAVAVSAETARNVRDSDQRRALLLEAAEFARTQGRSDLAAELTLEVFDEDASSPVLHELLDRDWTRPGLPLEHAALLESILRVCPVAHKTRWFEHYADCLEALPEHRETAQRARTFAQRYAEAPNGVAAQRELESLIAQLEARLSAVAGGPDEPAVLSQLSGWLTIGGDLRRAVSCGLRLASLAPTDTLAAARMWRATALRKDDALSRDALTWLARTQTDAAQARSLAGLARQLELLGDFDGALECAEATLASQPMAADAAIVVLRHAHRLPPPRAAALLSGLRPVLGSCPPLSLALAEAARAAGAREQALEALSELSAALPLLFDPLSFAIDLQASAGEPGPLLSAALALLAVSQEPSHVAKAEAAVLFLAELGAAGPAARLAQHILDARCRADLAYATSAAELARASGDADLLTHALERVVSMLHGAPQLESLAAVAEHHRRREDRVGEVRAWLRVLQLSPGHAVALDHLTRLFAESGDLARLLVVLSIGLETSADATARRQLLLEMASAAAHVGNDRERAALYVVALIQESVEDPEWLRTGLGALFALGEPAWAIEQALQACESLPREVAAAIYLWLAHRAEAVERDPAAALRLAASGARRFPTSGELLLLAERLSLAASDRTTAVGLYNDLIEEAIGDHGRRALSYRAGRWLERTGSYDDALAHYTRAFELGHSTGVAYKALERVARASRKLAPLAHAQETLAELATDDRKRVGLLQEAARTSLVDLDDPERGFRNLLKADAIAQVGELDDALTEATKKLGERDRKARERALLELAQTREARAQQIWSADQKAKLLLNAARLHLHERHDPEASAAALAPLLEQEVSSELSTELRADSLITLAEAQLGSGRQAEALASVERALTVAPDAREAMELKVRLSMPPAPIPASASEMGARASMRVFPAPAGEGRSAEQHRLLLERARTETIDVALLRELHSLARSLGAGPDALVAGQILSLFDRSLDPPEPSSFRADLMLPEEAWQFVHGDSDTDLRALMRMLWECVRAVPSLKRTPESFGLDPGLRALPEDRPAIVGVFFRLAHLLGLSDTPLYLRASANPSLELLPTHPPCLITYAKLGITPANTFRLAQHIVFAEPEHAVTCAIPEAEGRKLVSALLGAFGPPGSAGDLSREIKDLASQLWHAVPVRVQAQLRELVRLKLPSLAYERVRLQAQLCGHRAGLLASRDLRSALESFVVLQSDLRELDLRNQAGFEAAYAQSAGMRELIRVAFSEAYLSLAGLRAA